MVLWLVFNLGPDWHLLLLYVIAKLVLLRFFIFLFNLINY